MAETKRRARGEDSIYYDRSRDRWIGSITVGWKPDGRRDRITVRGRTKTEVKDKLRTRHQDLAAGVRTPANFTVKQCLKDWLETLNTQAESTVTGYRIMVGHLVELIGNVKLVELEVRDVDFALGKLAKRLSTRSVRLARMILIQAIRNAMVNDLVVRNVADPARVPTENRDAWSSSGSRRKRASAGTGRRASSATPLFRSCPIPAYLSSRSRTRWATPAPGRPRSSTDTSSARLRAPLLSR